MKKLCNIFYIKTFVEIFTLTISREVGFQVCVMSGALQRTND